MSKCGFRNICQKNGWLTAGVSVTDCPLFSTCPRYLYRGVLPDRDIIRVTHTDVTFRYRDSQTKELKTRTLPTLKFLWLILQHVLPKGMQRVRDYGFLRGNAKGLRIRIQLLLLQLFYCTPQTEQPVKSKVVRTCPCCQHEMACVGISRPS